MVEDEQKETSPEISEERWFRVRVPSAHTPKRGSRHNLYVLAGDATDALDKAQGMRGWKKDSKLAFPEVRELNDEETEKLLEIIEETENVTLAKAESEGFYGRRDNIEIY